MGTHIEVDPEELDAHAANILTLHQRFDAVLSAIDTVSQDDQAYGIICQFLPPILEGRQSEQRELTSMEQGNLERLAQALKDTASSYRDVDDAAAADLDQIEGEL
ncbi:type VII secretion target [Glycomyces sp. NPDC047010]|uniref:type VII secretion target n=1 Tax=Glycomyces sp. NPDC047010 TaxID=3155023 RepID=UPI0034105A41